MRANTNTLISSQFVQEMEELEKEKVAIQNSSSLGKPLPTSYSYDLAQGNRRPTYTPRKSAAMADYMMAKHIVETGNSDGAPPTPLSPALPSAAPVSPSRENYSPNKAAMMADYKLARDSVDQTLTSTLPSLNPDESVSESDIAALKKEMDDLRSQLSGVTNAVKVVAHELSSSAPINPTVTQSLPSPPPSADGTYKSRWARNPDYPFGVEEAQHFEVVGNVYEEENDDLISAAIEMEVRVREEQRQATS